MQGGWVSLYSRPLPPPTPHPRLLFLSTPPCDAALQDLVKEYTKERDDLLMKMLGLPPSSL